MSKRTKKGNKAHLIIIDDCPPRKKLDVFEMPSTLAQAKEQIREAELMYNGVVASLERNEKRAHTQQRELDGIYETNEEAALDEYDAAQEKQGSPYASTWMYADAGGEFELYDTSGNVICRLRKPVVENLAHFFWIPRGKAKAALDEYDAAQEKPPTPWVLSWAYIEDSKEFELGDCSGKVICRMSRSRAEDLSRFLWTPERANPDRA